MIMQDTNGTFNDRGYFIANYSRFTTFYTSSLYFKEPFQNEMEEPCFFNYPVQTSHFTKLCCTICSNAIFLSNVVSIFYMSIHLTLAVWWRLGWLKSLLSKFCHTYSTEIAYAFYSALFHRATRGLTVIVKGNGHSDLSSNLDDFT